MRHDAIVIGLGVMGAAALAELAARGLRVLGIERWDVPHAMGSSHGATRVIRKAYFEDPAYVPMLHRAWSHWEELERSAGETLLVRTGALHVGPSDHPGIEGVRRSAREHGLAIEALDAAAIAARFPAMRPHATDVGLLEHEGGYLHAERCVSALVSRALASGAEVHGRERVECVELGGAGARVITDRGEHAAAKIVLACGAWSEGDACPLPIPVPLTIERQVQLWLAPRDPALVARDRLPVFVRFGEGGCFYGIPPAGVPGVKVCAHHGGEVTRAERLDRALRPEDEERVRAFVRAHLPAADGPLLAARVCMYTNTPDDHFAIGPHPDHPAQVAIACGFSGHGFKLAPVVGEIVADVVTGRAPPPRLFDPERFARAEARL
jgi:sarcosine oxidase